MSKKYHAHVVISESTLSFTVSGDAEMDKEIKVDLSDAFSLYKLNFVDMHFDVEQTEDGGKMSGIVQIFGTNGGSIDIHGMNETNCMEFRGAENRDKWQQVLRAVATAGGYNGAFRIYCDKKGQEMVADWVAHFNDPMASLVDFNTELKIENAIMKEFAA